MNLYEVKNKYGNEFSIALNKRVVSGSVSGKYFFLFFHENMFLYSLEAPW